MSEPQPLHLPGRLMLALGLIGFGLVALTFHHVIDGLTPLDVGAPWFWFQGVGLTALGVLLAWPRTSRRAAQVLTATLGLNLVLHMPGLLARPGDGSAWVSMMQVLGLAAAMGLTWHTPDKTEFRRILIALIGLMLIVFGIVHWIYVDAITGMIPEWVPGRQWWPWVTGAANICAGLGLFSGVFARTAAAVCGLMFGSWVFLVHLPRLIATPGERVEWVGLALAISLIGAVWTAHTALARAEENSHATAVA